MSVAVKTKHATLASAILTIEPALSRMSLVTFFCFAMFFWTYFVHVFVTTHLLELAESIFVVFTDIFGTSCSHSEIFLYFSRKTRLFPPADGLT